MIAEMGVDMSAFDGEAQLASWAGVCPGSHESGGTKKSGRLRKGNVYLTTTLIEAAQSAVKKKDSYLRAKFHRLKARRGYKRAAMAIAHKILIAAYHVLRDATVYRDLGASYLGQLDERGVVRGLVGRLKRLGYAVDLNKSPA